MKSATILQMLENFQSSTSEGTRKQTWKYRVLVFYFLSLPITSKKCLLWLERWLRMKSIYYCSRDVPSTHTRLPMTTHSSSSRGSQHCLLASRHTTSCDSCTYTYSINIYFLWKYISCCFSWRFPTPNNSQIYIRHIMKKNAHLAIYTWAIPQKSHIY